MPADKTTIGARLRDERKRRGWDKPEMARRLADALPGARVDHESLVSYVKRWERGTVGVSERYRLAYARAFGLDEEALFRPPPPQSSLWTPPAVAETVNGTVSPDDEERLLLAAQRPARLDTAVVDSLATILAAQRRTEDAIGPAALVVPMRAQLDTLTGMLADARGPLRDPLGRIVAEWACFAGWLHAACHIDDRALTLWSRAEELADDCEDGMVAADAVSWPGHLALRQNRHRAVLRSSFAALVTPGAHETQRIFFTLRTARAYAALGEHGQARRLIDDAARRVDHAGEPPPIVYWHTPPFFEMYTGVVLGELGDYGDAAEMLRSGMEGMPVEQRGAEWMAEYEDALTVARDRA